MVNQNRNLFRLTRFILLKLPYVSRLFARFRKPEKKLLLVKTDAIGDYILFRNYIEVTKHSEKFKGYKIDLLGNILWRDIALQYDSSNINEFLFTSPDELYESPLKTFQLGCKLFKNNYEIVLLPSHRRLFITDGLAAITAAKQIIGFENNVEDAAISYKLKTDKFYSQKLILPPFIKFEFERTGFFFNSVLNSFVSIKSPSVNTTQTVKKGIIIFPGAGNLKRCWEAEKYLALIKLILVHTAEPVYLAGGTAEIALGNYLVERLPSKSINNLIGKTSLPQFIQLVGNAALVISNETSAVHIAAATQTKAVCILGGGHFARFAPYPGHFTSRQLCVYEQMECFGCNWNCKLQSKENGSFPCIAGINLENVWQATRQLLATA